MADDGRVTAILKPEEKRLLKQHADAEKRTLSGLVAIVLREWLEKNPL